MNPKKPKRNSKSHNPQEDTPSVESNSPSADNGNSPEKGMDDPAGPSPDEDAREIPLLSLEEFIRASEEGIALEPGQVLDVKLGPIDNPTES